MLQAEPVRWSRPSLQRKVSLIPKTPKNVASPRAVGVIDLDNPALVPYGKQQVPVGRGIQNRAGVRPVGISLRDSGDVKMVERIPQPHRVQIRIQNGRIERKTFTADYVIA